MEANNKLYVRLSYNCLACDAPWTGATSGQGIITIDLESRTVNWNKTNGCNPYWYQVFEAVMRITPPEFYMRERRVYPFAVNIKTGYSGCKYCYVNLYRKIDENVYYRWKCATRFDISANDKVDNFEIYYGDLVEIFRKLCEEGGWTFSRNPNYYTAKGPAWRFLPIRRFDIVSEEEVYDPTVARANINRDLDEDTNHRRSHRNRKRAFNHG